MVRVWNIGDNITGHLYLRLGVTIASATVYSIRAVDRGPKTRRQKLRCVLVSSKRFQYGGSEGRRHFSLIFALSPFIQSLSILHHHADPSVSLLTAGLNYLLTYYSVRWRFVHVSDAMRCRVPFRCVFALRCTPGFRQRLPVCSWPTTVNEAAGQLKIFNKADSHVYTVRI